MKNLTWQNPEQLFVAQELINKVKSKCCGIKGQQEKWRNENRKRHYLHVHLLLDVHWWQKWHWQGGHSNTRSAVAGTVIAEKKRTPTLRFDRCNVMFEQTQRWR